MPPSDAGAADVAWKVYQWSREECGIILVTVRVENGEITIDKGQIIMAWSLE